MRKGEFVIRRAVIAGVELVEANSDRSFARHTHDQFGIGVIFAGAQTSASGRGQVEAGAGDIITVNPGEVHDGSPIGIHGRYWKMLYLDPEVVAAAAGDIKGDRRDPEFRHPVLTDPSSAKAFVVLYAGLMEGKTLAGLAAESLLFELVERLMVEKRRPPVTTSSIARAKMMLDDAPAKDRTLDDLAREAGLGKFQLLRGFAKVTGLTPHAYLMQRRTDMARRMIRQGTSLADAAFSSGFADQSHMTRMFASKYGVTPGAYAAVFA